MVDCSLDNSGIMEEKDSLNLNSADPVINDISLARASSLKIDPQEGSSFDFRYLYVYYNSSYVYVYLFFYAPVSLKWGNPYIYLYDKADNNDRDMIILKSSSSFEIRRDKDHNGHFETSVYSGKSITTYAGGATYKVTIPKGALPDIGSRKIWAYSMGSKDRVPDSGYMEFSHNISTSTTDAAEGVNPDHSELEIGYDDMNSYAELDFHTVVPALVGGSPFIYLYDLYNSSQRYMVYFSSSTNFAIRQDTDSNGHFETLVYTGTSGLKLDGGKRYTITFPNGTIPSLATKKMWSYSMNSKDRIPNTSYLYF